MQAAILAGGAGTRLYPITAYIPKALIPIGGKYVVEYILEYLKRNGIQNVVMLASENDHELYRNHLGDGTRYGIRIEYSVAERIGTAGALGAASSILDDTFLAYYGDVLTDMDLKAMLTFHSARHAVCTLALSTGVPIDYGIARVSQDGRVIYFEEKPILKEYPVSMGIYAFEKEVLQYCKPHTDIAQDLIPRLMKDQKSVYAYLTPRRHYDIGTFKSLEEARAMLEQRQSSQPPS